MNVSNNETTDEIAPGTIYVSFFFLIPASLCGLTLNSLVLGLIATRQRLRSFRNLYLLNRSIADIFLQLPFAFVLFSITQDHFIFGLAGCLIYSIVKQVSILLATSTLVCITIDFYVSSNPATNNGAYRGQLRLTCFTVMWIGAAILTIVILFFQHYVQYREGSSLKFFCFPAPFFYAFINHGLYLSLPLGFLVSVVPVILVWVFIGLVICKHRSEPELASEEAGDFDVPTLLFQPTFNRRFVVALAVVFTPCQLAFWTYQIFFPYFTEIYVPYFYEAINCLLDVNAAINPVLYLIYCNDIQKEFIKLLPSCCKRNSSQNIPLSSNIAT